jgi:hypothetical protein
MGPNKHWTRLPRALTVLTTSISTWCLTILQYDRRPGLARIIRKFHDPSPTLILYVGPIYEVQEHVPFMSLLLHDDYTDHHTPAPSPSAEQISTLWATRLRRCFGPGMQEGKQCLQVAAVDVGV